MIKFFRTIRRQLLSENKFSRYFLYAVGEIILVVIGILIALSLNKAKEISDLEKEEIQLYSDIKTELIEDLNEMQNNYQYNNYFLIRYKLGSQIIENDSARSQRDSLAIIASELTKFSDFKNDRPIYDRLFTSGEQDLISDKELLRDLKRLAVSYNYINRLENNQQDYMYTVLPKIANYIRIKPPKIMDLDALYGYRFQNDIEILIMIMEEKNDLYNDAIEDLERLLTKLDTNLNS